MQAINRTSAELEQLKYSWRNDPCWDIEDTEGFEAHKDELHEYAMRMHLQWKTQAEAKEIAYAAKLGIATNPQLAAYIARLEHRIAALEQAHRA